MSQVVLLSSKLLILLIYRMSTIFSKIIAGEISSFKVAEDDNHLAFLDTFPLVEGHVLVIPKKETDYIFDIKSKEYMLLWFFAQQVAQGMKKVISCKRIGVSVIGLEVSHAHIHLIPMNQVEDMNFSRSKLQFSDLEFNEIAKKIRLAI